MKIFLTGGSGFIGKNIIEQLGHAHDIVAPSREELDLTNGDAVFAFLKKHPVDVVIHAANIGGTRKQQHVFGITHTNLKMFFNIVRAKPFFTRMITLGSGAEYDKQYPLTDVKESDFGKHVPNDEYGLYKYVCAEYASKVDFITHLRMFAVFGKYEDIQIRFISNAICKALLGMPITIRQNALYDYLFVDDLVRILDAFARHKPKETFFNTGRGESVDLRTIAKKVLRETGAKVPVLVQTPGRAKEYTCSTARLKKALKRFSYTPFDIAIAKLTAYYKSILPTIDRELLARDV
ncbi:MAG: NAD(P)-dependent oxidoreductase [Candidatus Harrisonbacteria bacterium]|nr:NAD(P)-dependent oxidoreductase [Candidatus Harrisonbacteria bacterium]